MEIDEKSLQETSYSIVPNFRFLTEQMWVDEPARQLYFIFNGYLLTVPLKQRKV